MITSTTNKTSGTAGTGAAQTIAFTFPYFTASEIIVITRNDTTGADTTLIENTDYTLTGTGSDGQKYSGGSVVTLTPFVAAGYTIYIYRATTETQDTDLTENDYLPAETLEARLDKLFCLYADLKEVVGRCIKVPLGDGTITTEVDDSVNRASKALEFDASGNVTVV
jgi:hypothetical protein